MTNRLQIVRLRAENPSYFQVDSLFTCKRGCDIRWAWPFGSAEKRRACKAACTEKWEDIASSEYPEEDLPEMDQPGVPKTAELIPGVSNDILMVGGGALVVYLLTRQRA